MKFRLAATALLLVLGAGLAAQEPDPSTAARIPMAEFQRLIRTGKVVVIDVRDAGSYAAGHIPGARSMPIRTILEPRNLAALEAAKAPIVLYCA